MTGLDTIAGESELQRRLRRMIELGSLERVSVKLGISREALARFLAGLPVQAGTRALIESRLREAEKGTKP